jgi:hypothetical protein
MELSSNLTQLFYSGSSLAVVGYFLVPPCYRCLIVSINESYRHFSCCQSLAPLTLTSYLSSTTCCYGYWLREVTIATTLIGTLSCLGSLGVVVALELINLILNMICTSIFLEHSPDLCSTL